MTGALQAKVYNGLIPVSGASVYWGDYPDGPDYLVGTTDSSGEFNINLSVGTYTGVYAKLGSKESLVQSVIINPNATTQANFNLTNVVPAPAPIPFICLGGLPGNAESWGVDETTGLSSNIDWKYANTPSDDKCEFKCADGFSWDESACVNSTSGSRSIDGWQEVSP